VMGLPPRYSASSPPAARPHAALPRLPVSMFAERSRKVTDGGSLASVADTSPCQACRCLAAAEPHAWAGARAHAACPARLQRVGSCRKRLEAGEQAQRGGERAVQPEPCAAPACQAAAAEEA